MVFSWYLKIYTQVSSLKGCGFVIKWILWYSHNNYVHKLLWRKIKLDRGSSKGTWLVSSHGSLVFVSFSRLQPEMYLFHLQLPPLHSLILFPNTEMKQN
jgi:hypothetical protein